MTLTIYILDVTNGDRDKTVRSCPRGLDVFFKICEEHDFSQMPGTDWKMYLYSDEWLSEALKEAIPVFLEVGKNYDFFSLYKRERVKHYCHIPRIFKANVLMKKGQLFPEGILELKGETILNGFLEG